MISINSLKSTVIVDLLNDDSGDEMFRVGGKLFHTLIIRSTKKSSSNAVTTL